MIFRAFRKNNGNGAKRSAAGPSIISSDVVIDGSVVTTGELQIDGTVHGTVRARSCVVDMQGVVEGEVLAEEVFIRGRVVGPIRGVHVHLHAGSHVEGDVINETIAIENGAYIFGSVRRSEDPLAEPAYGVRPHLPDFGPGANADFTQGDESYRPLRAIKPR